MEWSLPSAPPELNVHMTSGSSSSNAQTVKMSQYMYDNEVAYVDGWDDADYPDELHEGKDWSLIKCKNPHLFWSWIMQLRIHITQIFYYWFIWLFIGTCHTRIAPVLFMDDPFL